MQPNPGEHVEQREQRLARLVDAIEDYAIFMLDSNGIVCSWNAGARKIKGYEAHEVIGKSFTIFYAKADVTRGWPNEELQRAAEDGRYEDEGWQVRKSGERFWASVSINALRDEQGALYGFAKVTRDLTGRRKSEELLRQSEERFRLLVEGVQDYAIFMLDPQGRIESWNAGAQALTGYVGNEVMGQHFSLFFTAESRASGVPQRELNQAAAKGRFSDEGWRLRKDGAVFWASVKLTAIHDSDGRLRGFAKVTRDLTEQRRAMELEASGRRISEFLAILGHELRNPLAPIRNAVSIMQMDASFPAKFHPLRDILSRQMSNVTRLVDDLLDVGRITSGKITLRKERLVWQELVQHSIESVRPILDERGHHLNVLLPSKPIDVFYDSTRIQQVLQNILTNAAKFTEAGGAIEIRSEVDGDVLLTEIKDNGRGFEEGAADRIFDLFVQERRDSTGTNDGLGVGLAMARILVELHGGTIRARSDGLGQGSVFSVRLPLYSFEEDRLVKAEPYNPVQSELSVLVVDDNRDSAETMAQLILALGLRARVVTRPSDALGLALAAQPDLIFLDLHMPDQDGYGVLAELRRHPQLSRTVVVAMTGYGQEVDRLNTADAGFHGHLIKPVELADLKETLKLVGRS